MERTRILSDNPFTPGRRIERPRTIRSIFDAGLRGLVERLDDRGLQQRIHLGHDVGGAAGLGVLLLAADQAAESSRPWSAAPPAAACSRRSRRAR